MPGDFISSDTFKNPRRVRFEDELKRSKRAVVALFVALLAVLPAVPLIGALLGWRERGRIKNNPQLTGAGLAWAAVALGLIVTFAQAAVIWGGQQARLQTQTLVDQALREGQQGDVAGFTGVFTDGTTDHVDPRLTASFHKMLEHRYGKFVSATCDEPLAGVPVLDEGQTSVPYTVRFADATVSLTAQVTPAKLSGLWDPQAKLQRIVILDPEVGEIPFPPPAHAARPTASASVDTDR